MVRSGFSLYGVLLHLFLVGLGVATLLLALENRQLRQTGSGAESETLLVEGKVLEGFEVLSLEGETQELHFSGADTAGKDHLLFFFTTTCGVCAETQPVWRALYESLSGSAEIVAVSFDSPEATRTYRDRMNLPFPVVVISDPNAFAEEHRLYGVPFTLQIASDGEIRDSWLGALSEADVERIRSVIPVVASGG